MDYLPTRPAGGIAWALVVLWLAFGTIGGRAAGDEKSPSQAVPKPNPQAQPGQKVQPKDRPAPKEQRIHRLIEQLGNDDYSVRQRAQEELAKFGFDAYDELVDASTNPDLEIASRARYLLRLIRVQWTSENDPPAVRKILQDYEIQNVMIRARKIARLAGFSKGASLPALCRLVRFEPSTLLSKFAAIQILHHEPTDPAARARFAQLLRGHLGKGRQPAVTWLITYLRFRENPEAVLPEWTRLIEEEEALLRRSPEQTNPSFIAGLIYQQAQIELERGKKEAAEETARRAREDTPAARHGQLGAHLDTATALRERGLFHWAEAEYRHVIAAGVSADWVKAHIYLSEMFHDQGKHLPAAEARQQVVRAIEQNRLRAADVESLPMTPGEIHARTAYLFACHWQEQGDLAKQRKYLDEAIQAYPGEIDTLIACYRLPNPTPEYRRKIVGLIERAASEMLTEIEDQPDEPSGYNQYAWLIGNTEGDMDKALSFCQKALELSPDNGAYCDTLARVYYTRGDLESAVKYQSLAHEVEPHSGLIAKQLKLFQEASARKKGTTPKPAGK